MTAMGVGDDYEVPALAMAGIVDKAEQLLTRIDAENLRAPVPLDVRRMMERALPLIGIDVYPVDADEVPGSEAETRAGDDGRIHILVRESIYQAACIGGPESHRARSTLCHEVGHGVLHGPLLQRHREGDRIALRRVGYGNVQAFRSAEWQAFAFGATLLMPVSTMVRMRNRSPKDLSSAFQVSPSLAEKHLQRVESLLQ
jgi:hypothetical protein